ncbi:MAG: HNH endonuclease [Desulfobaccales bacterium]
MKAEPPFKCLFCLESNVPFNRIEHTVPESLGNDDNFLEPGFVCDRCNQYFGSEVENKAVNASPFGIERTGAAVMTKKGRLPHYKGPKGLFLQSTGFKDTVFIILPNEQVIYDRKMNRRYLLPLRHIKDDHYIVRMLLKIGLELLIHTSIDPYSIVFDGARYYARYPKLNQSWGLAFAVYPNRNDLIISKRFDDYGEIINHQIYQHEMGQMASGDIVLCFIYRQNIFACNLSNSGIEEYCTGFNIRNNIRMDRIYA